MATSKSKTSIPQKLRKAVIYSVNPFDYEQKDKFAVLMRFRSMPDDFSDEQISDMISRVYPEDYVRNYNWKEGDYKKGRTPPARVAERMDMLRLSIGDPQKYGTIEESEYIPSSQKDKKEKEKFYKYGDESQTKQLFDMVREHIPAMEKETALAKQRGKDTKVFNISPHGADIKEGDARFQSSMKHVGLERYQVSLGEDDFGKYMGIYDPWDIDYGEEGSYINNIAKKLIPGFEFYDRVYYKESQKDEENKNIYNPELQKSARLYSEVGPAPDINEWAKSVELRREPQELPPLKEIKTKKKPEDSIMDFMKRIF